MEVTKRERVQNGKEEEGESKNRKIKGLDGRAMREKKKGKVKSIRRLLSGTRPPGAAVAGTGPRRCNNYRRKARGSSPASIRRLLGQPANCRSPFAE